MNGLGDKVKMSETERKFKKATNDLSEMSSKSRRGKEVKSGSN